MLNQLTLLLHLVVRAVDPLVLRTQLLVQLLQRLIVQKLLLDHHLRIPQSSLQLQIILLQIFKIHLLYVLSKGIIREVGFKASD